MKKVLMALVVVSLTGCASIQDMIPSFWDDNEARAAVDLKFEVRKLDCNGDMKSGVLAIKDDIEWIEAYSQAKGSRDVLRMIAPIKATVVDFEKNIEQSKANKVYCDLKKRVMTNQANMFSKSLLGRY